jgi:hypothetical protein
MAALLNISMGRLTGISPWITAIVALSCSIIAVLLVIFEFTLGFEVIDRFFKKKQSVNVIGTLRRPGTKDVKRLLIVSGHHDSAWENTWFSLLGNVKRLLIPSNDRDSAREKTWLGFLSYVFLFASATWFLGFVTMAVMSILQLMGMLTGNADIVRNGTLGWVMLVYPIVPSMIFGMFFNRGRKNGGTVPGAVDNLSACALAVAACRFLVNNPAYIPADTEIRFISFGAEEAGVRGSRRYVERHLDELKRMDARLLNFETVAHPEIVILTSESSGTVKNSPEMVKSVVAAAERAGVPYQVKPSFFGAGSDAGPFSSAGLKATTLFPFVLSQDMVAFYHQKSDGPELLTIEPLLNVLKLTFEWVRNGAE